MSFSNGHPKSGGRKPGIPNKRTQSLVEILNEHDYSPVADLIAYSTLARKNYDLSSDPAVAANWAKLGVQCASSILPYVYPKRKPAEGDLEITEEGVSKLSNEELLQIAHKTIEGFKQ